MGIHEELNTPDFISPQVKVLVNIMYTGHWLTSGINRALKPLGLTEPQFNVLAVIYSAKGRAVSSSEIGRGMIQKESNITRIVDKLVGRRWVTRDVCPENRRKVDIGITQDGREAFKAARSAVLEFHKKLSGRLGDRSQSELSDLLDALRNPV